MQLLSLLLLCLPCGDRILSADYINETTITFSKDPPKKSFDNIAESPDHHPSSATSFSKGNEWFWDICFEVYLNFGIGYKYNLKHLV